LIPFRKTVEIRALSRAAQILASVNADPAGATLSKIVDSVALSKATTYRFVQALLRMDFLRLEPETGTYYIGPALLRFGRLGQQHEDLRMIARPFLEELREATGETLTLVVPSGRHRLTIDVVLSEHELRAAPELGGIKPIHAGAAGKAMLAWYTEADFLSLFDGVSLKQVTTRTVTSARVLERELARIRQRGYATSIGETVYGQSASAAPLLGDDEKVVGSLNVSGPTIRLPAAALRRNGEIAAAAAAKLSKKIGSQKPLRAAEKRSRGRQAA
jgi:DNA-binding IclR family transcriptional regulator